MFILHLGLYHQVKLSSMKSTTPTSCTSLTAPLTSSARPPGPQTVTHMAPTRSLIAASVKTRTLGLLGYICTVELGLWGRVTNSLMVRTSLRFGSVGFQRNWEHSEHIDQLHVW